MFERPPHSEIIHLFILHQYLSMDGHKHVALSPEPVPVSNWDPDYHLTHERDESPPDVYDPKRNPITAEYLVQPKKRAVPGKHNGVGEMRRDITKTKNLIPQSRRIHGDDADQETLPDKAFQDKLSREEFRDRPLSPIDFLAAGALVHLSQDTLSRGNETEYEEMSLRSCQHHNAAELCCGLYCGRTAKAIFEEEPLDEEDNGPDTEIRSEQWHAGVVHSADAGHASSSGRAFLAHADTTPQARLAQNPAGTHLDMREPPDVTRRVYDWILGLENKRTTNRGLRDGKHGFTQPKDGDHGSTNSQVRRSIARDSGEGTQKVLERLIRRHGLALETPPPPGDPFPSLTQGGKTPSSPSQDVSRPLYQVQALRKPFSRAVALAARLQGNSDHHELERGSDDDVTRIYEET